MDMTSSIAARALVLIAFGVVAPTTTFAQPPRLNLDHLNRLAAQAAEVVDVNIDASMLEQAAVFLSRHNTNDPRLKSLLQGIKAIYVKAFEFKTEGAKDVRPYSDADIEEIRKQLSAPGWSRVVSVREDDELTEVYFWKETGENGGLAVIAAEHDELVVVNIVGRVDLATLATLGPMIPRIPGAASKFLKR
jgi:hypothetical protein